MVALSSTESEYIALSNAVCEAIWLKQLLDDFQMFRPSPVVIYEDNQSTIALSHNSENAK